MFRYFALTWDARSETQNATAAAITARIERLSAWQRVSLADGLRVFASGINSANRIHLLEGNAGAVVGTLFKTPGDGWEPPIACGSALNAQVTAQILATGGRHLVENYWGNYVAFLVGERPGEQRVLKDPTGALPCHFAEVGDILVFFSALVDFVRLRISPLTIDARYLQARVAYGSAWRAGESLKEVRTLHGGECKTIGAATAPATYWSPLKFVRPADIGDHAAAARQLRVAARACTQAWASCHRDILHRLSGGLDSSIVLGCLMDFSSRPNVTCLTYFIPRGSSDERPWARLAAQSGGCRQVEHARNPLYDLTLTRRLLPSPHPVALFSYIETSAVEAELAQGTGSSAIFNGDGGDSLFGRYAVRHGMTDFVRDHGLGRGLLAVAEDVALATDQSIWNVLAGAVRAFAKRSDIYDRRLARPVREMVSPALLAGASGERPNPHPWFQGLAHVPASVILRLGFLLQQEPCYSPIALPEAERPDIVSPLLSQPVVETCLRIPMYMHIRGGHDRALARSAFTHEVPASILARTWKDRAQGFLEEVFAVNREAMREILMDGVLAREGLLDRVRVERALSSAPGKRTGFLGEIFDHFGTESWIASLARERALPL